MSFKIGDRVVCDCPHAKGIWIGDSCTIAGPHHGDIDFVSGFDADGYLLLEGYNQGSKDGFNPKHFRKVEDNFGSEVAERIEQELNKKVKELTEVMDSLNLTRR